MNEYKATYSNTDGPAQPRVTLEADTFTLGVYHIMNWHSFDDMGTSLETVQVWNPRSKRLFEIYSSDEGETFTFCA